jgi:thiamine pyridinylase
MVRKGLHWLGFGMLVVFLLTGCATTPRGEASEFGEQPPAATLRVALFPFIPDSGRDNYRSLSDKIKQTFEQKYPTIRVVLRPLDPVGDSDAFYNTDKIQDWLKDAGDGGYDVIEIDTVLLGDVVASGLIETWPTMKTEDWHPVAVRSVTVNEAVYAVPHLMCGHFLFTRNVSASTAKNVDELSFALRHSGLKTRPLVADLAGSFNLPALYLDAWADGHAAVSPAAALHGPLDDQTVNTFKKFTALCGSDGKNPCLEGTYHDNPVAASEEFALDKAQALVAYSESLSRILAARSDTATIYVSAAPMGLGNRPLLFADAFILRANTPDNVRLAARLFVEFMTGADTQQTLLMSGDVTQNATPRYLLPATLSAFSAPRVKRDPYYQKLRELVDGAAPFPNTGFANARKSLRDNLKKVLVEP